MKTMWVLIAITLCACATKKPTPALDYSGDASKCAEWKQVSPSMRVCTRMVAEPKRVMVP